MANASHTTPSATALGIAGKTYQLLQGVEFFFTRTLRRRQRATVMTRADYVEQFLKEGKCSCYTRGEVCGSCEHIIKDVFGD